MMLNVPHIFLLWSYRLRRRDQERRRAAELVAAKEAELRDMFERSPVSVVIASVDGEFRFANSSWLKLMKLEQEELGRHHIWETYFDPQDRVALLQEMAERGSVRDREMRYRRSDGETVWALLSADFYPYQGEKCLVSWFVDITERKAAEQTVREAEGLLRTALDNMSDGLYMVDKDFNVQIANGRYREFLGFHAGLMKPGDSLRASMRYRAERGDYGAGDAEALIERRL